jgi:DNA invertase Pin-like site-specific DNA recombinase
MTREEPMPKPVGVYVRVSSGKGQKDDSQRDVIGQWLANNGVDPDAIEWYADVESGRKMTRPEFDRLQRDIFQGTVKTVVVYKVDRVARRLREGINVLCEWCDKGVRFVSVTQHIDVNGVVGRMVAAVMLGLAELEWEYRRDRQRAGIETAKKKDQNKPPGEKTYKGRVAGTTNGKPERAAELRAKGLTADEIAASMKVSVRTVWRYIGSNP